MLIQTSKINQSGHILLPQIMLDMLDISPETSLLIRLTESGIVIEPAPVPVKKHSLPVEDTKQPLNRDLVQVRQTLQEAGMLTELGPSLQKRAETSSLTLDEAIAITNKIGNKALSDIVLEQRSAKDW